MIVTYKHKYMLSGELLTQETVATKIKKKKTKTTVTKKHWDDLFILPERPSRVSEAETLEQDVKNKM